MIAIHPRESVIMASDFHGLIGWYRDVLGFNLVNLYEEAYHYGNLETPSGIKIGIADADEMGIVPADRSHNTVVLKFQVDDVKAFFAFLEQEGAAVTFGPSHDESGDFWYGGFSDPEGNPFWVVDKNCP